MKELGIAVVGKKDINRRGRSIIRIWPKASVPYLWQGLTTNMKQDSVRTTVDIPAPLYRKLKQRAAAEGSSIRQLVISERKNLLVAGGPATAAKS